MTGLARRLAVWRRTRRTAAMRLWIAIGAGLMAVLLWGGIWFHLRIVRADDLAEAEHSTSNIARAFEEHIFRTLRNLDQALLRVRAAYAAQPSQFDFDAALHDDGGLSDLIIGISLINRDGALVWASTGSQPDLHFGDRESFRYHADGQSDDLYIGRPMIGHASGRLTIQITRRIIMPDGSFGGVAAISLDPNYLTNFYNSIDLGPGGTIVLLGTDGYLRALPSRGPFELNRDLRQTSVMRAQALKPDGLIHAVSRVDGTPRIVAYRTLTTLPLIVAVGMTEADALAPYGHQQRAVLIAGALVTLVFGTLALLLMRQVGSQARVEEQLRQAKNEAEAANLAKSEFLANVSHELRTPLNAVIGFSEIMRDALMGPIDNRYREYAQDIHDSGQHLLRLIGDVLDLSKIGAGRLELHDEPVDLGQLLQTCQRLITERAREGHVMVEIDLARDLPVVLADPLRLKQIILNLLSNAVKFTAESGQVTARAAPDAEGGVTVTFADTGIGMSPQDIQIALEPFRQVDNAMSRRYEGTGLGLPLAKQLTELHGGVLEIVSEPGVGTTIRVRLPARRVLRQIDLATEARNARIRATSGRLDRE
jgi:signal transduction histidine kinase